MHDHFAKIIRLLSTAGAATTSLLIARVAHGQETDDGATPGDAVNELVTELPGWLRDELFFGVAWWQVLGLLGAIFVGFVVRAIVASLVATQSAKLIHRWGERADLGVLAKAARPIGTVAMAGVLFYFLPSLQLPERAQAVAIIALRVLAALAAVVVLYRLVDVLADVFAQRAEKTETKLDDQLVPLIRRSLKVFVVAMGVIFVLQNMDVDVGSLLAGASLGGLAFTLAAKDTVANLFGSVSIFADRPFQVGDWVVIEGSEGIVEEVGMRSTRIRTFYNSLVTVPNSRIASAVVDNYGARTYRRTFTTLGLTYDTTPEQMEAFCAGVRAILAANSHVRQDYYEVHFSGYGDHALEVMVYFFFKVASWSDELRQRHAVYLEILRLAKDLGVSFAFPTRTIHIAESAEPAPARPHVAPPDDALAAAVLGFGPGGERSRPVPRVLGNAFFAGGATKSGGEDGG